MKYLIYTKPDDAHAVIVKLVLEELGHEVQLWFAADQPSLLTHSVSVNLHRTFWASSDHMPEYGLSEFDVIWHRRVDQPKVPKHLTHPGDYTFVIRENRLFLDSITSLLSPQAWWVNDPLAARLANSKLLQLHLAKKCGLQIPATLCSNSPQDIKSFIKAYQKEGVIYKALCPNIWAEKANLKALYTAIIDAKQLPSDEVLKLTPGIYQPYVKKKYELRVNCFGKDCVATKVNSQEQENSKIDWRASSEDTLSIEPYHLPQAIEFKLQSLMRQLGLAFGCIDMIVSPENEYIFLEINEQGQFLWIEEMEPNILLLDRFVNFMQHRSFYFNWNPREANIRLKDYQRDTIQQVKENMAQHVYENLPRA